jgi:hypothetical protein
MVAPRGKPIPVFALSGSWKVTARYSVRMTSTKEIACVRVRGPGFHVMHFALDEFNRLFRALPTKSVAK